MKYIVVSVYRASENIEKRVKELIDIGWVPIGGICATYEGNATVLYQAMIKEEK